MNPSDPLVPLLFLFHRTEQVLLEVLLLARTKTVDLSRVHDLDTLNSFLQ